MAKDTSVNGSQGRAGAHCAGRLWGTGRCTVRRGVRGCARVRAANIGNYAIQ